MYSPPNGQLKKFWCAPLILISSKFLRNKTNKIPLTIYILLVDWWERDLPRALKNKIKKSLCLGVYDSPKFYFTSLNIIAPNCLNKWNLFRCRYWKKNHQMIYNCFFLYIKTSNYLRCKRIPSKRRKIKPIYYMDGLYNIWLKRSKFDNYHNYHLEVRWIWSNTLIHVTQYHIEVHLT